MTANTDISVAQKACVMVGIEPITDFNPTPATAESVLLDEMYEVTVEAELENYPYRFAQKFVELSADAAAPQARWARKHELPTDVLSVRTVLVGGYPIRYDRYENFIFSDTSTDDTVILEYSFRQTADKWSPMFCLGMISRLAAHLAISVQERDRKSQELNTQADVWFIRAQTRDSQGQSSKGFIQDQFTSRRLGGRRSRLTTTSNST